MPDIKEHVVFVSTKAEAARTVRTALARKFSSDRLWICILKADGKALVTVSDHWGTRLSEERVKPVVEFVRQELQL